jgi:hypothetical protein
MSNRTDRIEYVFQAILVLSSVTVGGFLTFIVEEKLRLTALESEASLQIWSYFHYVYSLVERSDDYNSIIIPYSHSRIIEKAHCPRFFAFAMPPAVVERAILPEPNTLFEQNLLMLGSGPIKPVAARSGW